ncbi:MAG TPA: hypothetical protein VF746_22080 [Longimicrobium sp.]|jgi:ABC-type phosphate transport system substrate-binding protein
MARSSRALRGALAALLLAAAAPAPAPGQTAARRAGPAVAVAIVVHPQTRVENLTLAQLRRIFLGEQQFWPDRQRVTLLMRAPVAAEREMVLRQIYRMTEAQFRQYWIAKIFRAEATSGPQIVYSNDMARELVTSVPGAITFVPAAAVRPGMRMVRIDGRLPGEAGYPLQ